MSEEMQIDGKPYISSKRAADLSGYAQDYIGQLARKSLIDARRIGGLWYISLESLQGYQKKADEYKPIPPARPETPEPSTLIFFDGREYMSAARAAEKTGYTQDYVGQLARAGTVLSRQIGNRWYVDRDALLRHKKEKDALLASVQAQSVGLARQTPKKSSAHAEYADSEAALTYFKDDADLIPAVSKQTTVAHSPETEPEIAAESNVIPIHRMNRPLSRPMPVKRTQMLPFVVISGVKNPRSPLLLIGAATIVIVISAGYASILRQNSVYATNALPGGTQMNAFGADAYQIADQIGTALEPLLTRELFYERSQ